MIGSDLLWVLTAGFGGGALNAMAGGGTFLTLPVLVAVGLPPISASATSTAALLPGYLAGAFGFRRQSAPLPGMASWVVFLICLLGGSCGAALLVVTPPRAFSYVVPWLLLAATVLFAAGPMLAREGGYRFGAVFAGAGMFLIALYGGYFNGGLGILLLAFFGLLGVSNLNAMNCAKALISALLTTISVTIYALGELIVWKSALPMMVATVAGGYAGARLSIYIPRRLLRAAITMMGLCMASIFFARL